MRNVFLIARREYLEQIRGRAFRLSTVGLPMLFAVVVAIGYAASLGLGSHKHLAVASSDLALANDVREHLVRQKGRSAAVDVVWPLTPQKRAALTGMLQAGMLDGVLWIEDGNNGLPTAAYTSKSSGDFMTASRLREAVNGSIEEQRLTGSGMTIAQANAVAKGIKIETFQVKSDGSVMKSNAEASFWKGYIMAFLLSMTTMLYGMNVARSIIQEKTSRIFEVMLATVKPSDMLAGKLVGVGAVGLTQIGIWLIAGLAILASPFAAAVLTGEFSIHFSWSEAILFPVYFVLGYLLYSSLFAGLAATCETEQELQMYMPLAAAPTWLSFALIVLVMNDSNSVWSVAASLFPPTAPVIMFLRMASEMPPVWQFAASIALLVISILCTLWFASRLYRIGILMYGKRATIPEIMRWLRYR
jgi:ABC-2 type transport system permease protein